MANFFDKIFAARKSPTEAVSPLRALIGRSSGVVVNEDSAMQVSAFYRGLIYKSTQIAKLPWNVKDSSNNILNDDISYLLSLAPNPEMNAMQFRLWAVQTAIIKGNAYSEIERRPDGKPVAIWPILGSVEPVRLTDGRLVYKVLGGSAVTPGADAYLRPEDVFHVRNFHTKDGIIGQGVVAYARDVLGISLAADQFAGNLFSNGGLPSGVLTVPGGLDKDQQQRLEETWKAAHGGRKTGRTAVLEEGAKYEAISIDPEAMQMLESRKFGVLEIARFLGVPPTKLFDTQTATFSNQEQSNLEVATDILDAWVVNLEMEADIKILNKRRGGKYSEIDLYAVFRGDMKTRADYNNKMMQSGAITPNEIRDREGYAPYEEGDNFYISTNNFTPVKFLDDYFKAQISKNNSPQTPAGGQQQPKPEAPKAESELALAAVEFLKRK